MAEIKEEEEVHVPGWMKALAILSGVVSIIASLAIIVYPRIAGRAVEIFFAIALLLIGIDRLASGISGRPFKLTVHGKSAAA